MVKSHVSQLRNNLKWSILHVAKKRKIKKNKKRKERKSTITCKETFTACKNACIFAVRDWIKVKSKHYIFLLH